MIVITGTPKSGKTTLSHATQFFLWSVKVNNLVAWFRKHLIYVSRYVPSWISLQPLSQRAGNGDTFNHIDIGIVEPVTHLF